MKTVAPLRFPNTSYSFVTWGVKPDSGGLTVTLLHRAGIMSQAGAGHIDVLTFDNVPNYDEIERELRQMGRIFGDVSLVNIWDDLRTRKIAAPTKPARTDVLIPIADDDDYESTFRNGREISRTRFVGDTVTALQIDYYREDGSLLASDRRDVKNRGTVGGRWITLCDETGTPIRSWSKATAFYHYVLDRLRAGGKTTYLVDSKTTANFMAEYRRKDALVVHIIQGSHYDGHTPDGRLILNDARSKNMQNLFQFDLVATLTKRQKKDITALVGASPNVAVIPNSVPLPDPASITKERDVARGVVIAAFVPRKRVPLAIQAAALAHTTAEIHLDVYGDGAEDRPAVEAAVASAEAQDFITLRGYSTEALAHTRTASFILITSETEGTPLVLLEGMAAGCIPISFDIPYGPSDVISHGKNGFLIPDGDVDAMARAIIELQNMPEEKVLAMRSAAMDAVTGFSDAAVLELWAKNLTKAWRRKESPVWKLLRRRQEKNATKAFARSNPEIAPKPAALKR